MKTIYEQLTEKLTKSQEENKIKWWQIQTISSGDLAGYVTYHIHINGEYVTVMDEYTKLNDPSINQIIE